jgi:hypothetical protein
MAFFSLWGLMARVWEFALKMRWCCARKQALRRGVRLGPSAASRRTTGIGAILTGFSDRCAYCQAAMSIALFGMMFVC